MAEPQSQYNIQRSAAQTTIIQIVEKPKRPLTAYNIFFKIERIKLVEEIKRVEGPAAPKHKFANLAKTIGDRWNHLGDEAKVDYIKLSKKDGLRYKKEMVEWRKLTKPKKKQGKRNSVSTGGREEDLHMSQASQEVSTVSSRITDASDSQIVHFDNIAPFEIPAATTSIGNISTSMRSNGTSGIHEVCSMIQDQQKGELLLGFMDPMTHHGTLQDQGTSISLSSPGSNNILQLPYFTHQQAQDKLDPRPLASSISLASILALNSNMDKLMARLEDDCVDWIVDAFSPSA